MSSEWPDIEALLEEKHQLHQAHINDPKSVNKKALYDNTKKTMQRELRQMQDKWFNDKAEEIQSYADRNNMKFYSSLKAEYGPQSSISLPLFSADVNSQHR